MEIQRASSAFLFAAASLTLAACGGSDSGPAPVPAPTPTPAPTPPPASITISGTAVKGAALGGAAISVKCATGSGSTTASATGTYSASLVGGALPCVVRAAGTDGTTYHSLVAGTGNTGSFAANVSPLTELVVAHVAAGQPAAYFTSFGSTTTIPAANVAAAIAYVQAAMAGLTDLAGVNPLTDTLVVGNALDQKIDQVMAGLASAGTTLTQVTTAVASNPTTPSVVATSLSSSATSCAWLKSGKYRVLNRSETDPKLRFQQTTLNATSLTVTDSDNFTATFTSDGDCQFRIEEPDATVKLIASSGGVLMIHAQSKTQATARDLFIALPEQTLPASELAGTWNISQWDPTRLGISGEPVAANAELTFDATGQVTALKGCLGNLPCEVTTGFSLRLTENPAGGFDLVEDGATVARAFMHKTLAGQKVLVLLDTQDSIVVFAPKQALTLPAVDTVNRFRTLRFFGADLVDALTEDEVKVTAVDTTARTLTRIRTSDGRVDTLGVDKPREGLRYRAGNSCTVGGAPVNCAEVVQMPLSGYGITLTVSTTVQPTGSFLEFSVSKP